MGLVIAGDQTSRLNKLFMSCGESIGTAKARFGMVDAIKAPAARNEATVDPKEV